jgi:hypothetical protein
LQLQQWKWKDAGKCCCRKIKKTQVYEQAIERKIDLGLVEVTKGNNFNARVYPIPARRTKKNLIAYE